MQRHFSNRGEALAEVTAQKMLARRQKSNIPPVRNAQPWPAAESLPKVSISRAAKPHVLVVKKEDLNL